MLVLRIGKNAPSRIDAETSKLARRGEFVGISHNPSRDKRRTCPGPPKPFAVPRRLVQRHAALEKRNGAFGIRRHERVSDAAIRPSSIQVAPAVVVARRACHVQILSFADEYISDGCILQEYLHPGRLIIVDLRDEFIDKDEALGLFVVMMNIFSGKSEHNGVGFNKFIVFDEAHKYMDNRDLVGSITTAIREMRHKGVSIMIASQDPMSLPTEIIELSSIVIMYRFSSPGWVKHVQKAITALQNLTPGEMANLGSGEAFLWAVKSTDKSITLRPTKISIRPRVTKHGGDTISAVKG